MAPKTFDPRIVPESVQDLIRACQRRIPSQLAGGAALAGVHLRHRLSNDIDLFCRELSSCRELVRLLPEIATETGMSIAIVRDAGSFVRARVIATDARRPDLEIDIVHETSAELEPPLTAIDGITVASLADLRASKLTCILSRSEPRDLVDVLFLERAGFRPEDTLPLALRKDAGIDPGVLAWLLAQFPTAPLPMMLEPLSGDELRTYRDALAERFRRVAIPEE